MRKRMLRDLAVSAIGLGCMGFSHGYGPAPERNEAIQLLRTAYELGCTFFDTAEVYGNGANEILVGEAFKPVRNHVVLATKLHIPEERHINVRKEIKAHLEASLKRMQLDCIDLYYQHCVNRTIPVEEVAVCMGELIREGKIRGWGQSQATADEIRRAHAITPLTAVQSEYSMMERMFEKDVIPLCGTLGIGFVPFSPLASGFLSGKYTENTQYTGDDVRRAITRFKQENIAANQILLDTLRQFAAEKNVTLAQISLAWMLHKENYIVPIPGMRNAARFRENFGACDVTLSEEEYAAIEAALAKIEIHGNRTDADIAKLYTSGKSTEA